MPDHPDKTRIFEDARIIFKNFAGLERQFNTAGDRNFLLLLDPPLAKEMKEEGWRVKQLKPREDEEEGEYYLKVNVNYKTGRPPRVVTITRDNHTELGQDEVGLVDVADIDKIDLVVNGWWSDMAGGGYGGFLKQAFVTLHENEMDQKYKEIFASQAAGIEDDE